MEGERGEGGTEKGKEREVRGTGKEGREEREG